MKFQTFNKLYPPKYFKRCKASAFQKFIFFSKNNYFCCTLSSSGSKNVSFLFSILFRFVSSYFIHTPTLTLHNLKINYSNALYCEKKTFWFSKSFLVKAMLVRSKYQTAKRSILSAGNKLKFIWRIKFELLKIFNLKNKK